MLTRTLIVRQAPRRFIVVKQKAHTMECDVLTCHTAWAGLKWYVHQNIQNAARESWAQRYRTVKDALDEHPEAERAPEYDIEGGE